MMYAVKRNFYIGVGTRALQNTLRKHREQSRKYTGGENKANTRKATAAASGTTHKGSQQTTTVSSPCPKAPHPSGMCDDVDACLGCQHVHTEGWDMHKPSTAAHWGLVRLMCST